MHRASTRDHEDMAETVIRERSGYIVGEAYEGHAA
jgi:hypothetical protein